MVRQLKWSFGGKGKAMVLLAAACGAMLWHLLACTESPMSFAPDGDLAFVTMEPYGDAETLLLRGGHAYRLMVLPKGGKEVKVLDESVDCMFSAPAFSPDGKRIAYLRIPLLTEAGFDGLSSSIDSRQEALRLATSQPTMQWPSGVGAASRPANRPATQPEESHEDFTLPPYGPLFKADSLGKVCPTTPVELIERDSADGRLLTTTKVNLLLLNLGHGSGDKIGGSLLYTYILAQLQYAPDGNWIYMSVGNIDPGGMAVAVNPQTREQRFLAAPIGDAALSPDGRILATLQKGCIGFIRTDGQSASFRRWEEELRLGALAWVDNKTIILLSGKGDLAFVNAEGNVTKELKLPVAASQPADRLGVSRNGKSMVLVTEKTVFFMEANGKVIGSVEHDNNVYVQPTFTPDGKEVAFKYMQKAENRAEAIVFFNPKGKELRRVEIPRIRAGTTKPVSTQPATKPAPAGSVPGDHSF